MKLKSIENIQKYYKKSNFLIFQSSAIKEKIFLDTLKLVIFYVFFR